MSVRGAGGLRVVIVGTGTGVGKTHVGCALLGCWSAVIRVVGLKPIETGVDDAAPGEGVSDQELLARAAELFHVKRRSRSGRSAASKDHRGRASPAREPYAEPGASVSSRRAAGGASRDSPNRHARPDGSFHLKKHRPGARTQVPAAGNNSGAHQPRQAFLAFPPPISPHLAARQAGVRIDLGAIDRWVRSHEAPVTVIETAGGLFSPLGHASTNFDLAQALRPHVVLLVAPDRLGVLHELTTTLALVTARGGPQIGVVLSAPKSADASTGLNAAEIEALGIARPIAIFPRAAVSHAVTLVAARLVVEWIERSLEQPTGRASRGPTHQGFDLECFPRRGKRK